MHFRGATIQYEPTNCVRVVKQEVELRRTRIADRARQEEMERQKRNEAIVAPIKKIARLLKRE